MIYTHIVILGKLVQITRHSTLERPAMPSSPLLSVEGLGFRVKRLGFRVLGLGFRLSGFRIVLS